MINWVNVDVPKEYSILLPKNNSIDSIMHMPEQHLLNNSSLFRSVEEIRKYFPDLEYHSFSFGLIKDDRAIIFYSYDRTPLVNLLNDIYKRLGDTDYDLIEYAKMSCL